MDNPSMAHPAPQRSHLRRPVRRGGVCLCGLALLLGAAIATPAAAQVVIGDPHAPAVTVNEGVLDQLGPPPTLPQLFGARHKTAHATTAKRTPKQRAATRRPVKRTAARAATRRRNVARSSVIHLIPPHAQEARRAPTPVERREPAAARPKVSAVALAAPVPAPAPLPKLPQADAIPAQPSLPPTPPHEVAPKPHVAPSPADNITPALAPPAAASTASSTPATAAPAPATPSPAATASAAPSATPSAPAAPPAAAAVRMAAATTVGNAIDTIKFAPGVVDLPPGPQPMLDAIAAKVQSDASLRVQIISHATGSGDDAMEARRISLARAIAVRAYLINKGVRSLRIDVRALGNRAEDGPVADQVDLTVVSQ